jgi:hypothetical protein
MSVRQPNHWADVASADIAVAYPFFTRSAQHAHSFTCNLCTVRNLACATSENSCVCPPNTMGSLCEIPCSVGKCCDSNLAKQCMDLMQQAECSMSVTLPSECQEDALVPCLVDARAVKCGIQHDIMPVSRTSPPRFRRSERILTLDLHTLQTQMTTSVSMILEANHRLLEVALSSQHPDIVVEHAIRTSDLLEMNLRNLASKAVLLQSFGHVSQGHFKLMRLFDILHEAIYTPNCVNLERFPSARGCVELAWLGADGNHVSVTVFVLMLIWLGTIEILVREPPLFFFSFLRFRMVFLFSFLFLRSLPPPSLSLSHTHTTQHPMFIFVGTDIQPTAQMPSNHFHRCNNSPHAHHLFRCDHLAADQHFMSPDVFL